MVTVPAHAKINIGLQVVRRRDDGYHDIDTVFHRIGWHDTLAIARGERGITLRCTLPGLPADEGNLCVRAARMWCEAAGYDGGLRMDLDKRIPVGAGLGGGSSDAAAVLRALPRLLDIPLPEEDLFRIALALGSDVPYFLHDGSAHARGRGELLSYFPLSLPYWIVTVHPGIHISTAWAYSRLHLSPALALQPLREILETHLGEPRLLVNRIRNDFEAVVLPAHEDVLRSKELLYRSGADFALMSGSGSSVFGWYRDETYAREAAAFIGARHAVHVTAPDA